MIMMSTQIYYFIFSLSVIVIFGFSWLQQKAKGDPVVDTDRCEVLDILGHKMSELSHCLLPIDSLTVDSFFYFPVSTDPQVKPFVNLFLIY